MTKIMTMRLLMLFLIIVAITISGCLKETYDMDKLSEEVHLSPTMAISAVKGNVSFSDIVKSSDTVVFDQNKFVKLVFEEDSVINLELEDFYNLTDMVSFTESYEIGALSISPFSSSITYSLDQISQKFSSGLRSLFLLLDDGLNHPFPAFPSTNMGEISFSPFTNFQNAVFSSGFLDITIRNNLTAPLSSTSVTLFNSAGHTPIGTALTVPAVQPGQTQTTSMDLTDKSITNSIIAAVVLSGSPGNATPVKIDLDLSNIQITVRGRNLKVKSGRAILPAQTVESIVQADTIDFDPGNNVEVDEIRTTAGSFSYRIESSSPLKTSLDFLIPTAIRAGVPLEELITVPPNSILNGAIGINNTVFDLSTDPDQPYNRLPLEYTFIVSSEGIMVTFNSTDAIKIELKMSDPDIDYVKGYFGQQIEVIDPDTIVFDIEEILGNITGDFLLSSPSLKINYSNSFAVPIEVTLNAVGQRESETVSLGLAPFLLNSPAAPAIRDVSGSFTIDKNNSSFPELISLPPELIRFTGSTRMNPTTGSSTLRNNYIFGKSRFLGSAEIEVPLEFRMNNLQFTDTVENFLASDNAGDDGDINADDFEMLRIDISAKNGFPMGVSLQMSLYDTLSHTVLKTITAADLLKAAPVDANGKSTGVSETTTSIEFTKDFFKSVNKAGEIIFRFTLNTTDNGAKDVKIYSDYSIDFKAALVVKADLNLK